jgi:large subunit ribosomal protein L25
MATVNEFKASARSGGGKGAARAERRAGRVPGVIYGDDQPPMHIAIEHAELRQKIFAGHFLTTVAEVEIEGKKHRVIPRDYQLDPIKDLPIHVDFQRLGVGATIRVSVPVHTINSEAAPGIKRGGTVNLVTHTIEVRCPADAIPQAIEVDLTGLEINHSRHLSDIQLPPGVQPISRGDQTLVTIVPPSGYAEELKAAADTAATAAAAAAATAATPAAGAAGAAGGGDKKGGDKK